MFQGKFMDRTSWKLEEILMVITFLSLPFDRATTLYVIGSSFYVTVPKILIGITLVIYFFRAIIIADQDLVTTYFANPTNFLLIAFLFISFCALFNAHDIKEFFKELLRRTNLIVFSFLIINVIRREKLLKACLFFLMIGGVCAALGGIHEMITQRPILTVHIENFVRAELMRTPSGGFRVQSFSGDPDNHVTNMVIYSGIMAGFFFLVRSKILKFFILSSFILLVANVIGSGSRSGMLAFIFCMVVFFIFVEMRWKLLFVASSVFIVLGVYLCLAMFTDVATLERFTSAGGGFSVRFREAHLILNMSMASDHPVIGIGTGNFKVNYIRYLYQRGIEGLTGAVAIDDHLPYFEILAENGIIGFIIFISLIISVIIMMIIVIKKSPDKSLRIMTEGLIGSMGGIFVVYGLLPALLNELGWLVMSSGVIVWNIYRGREEIKPTSQVSLRVNLPIARVRLGSR